METKLTIQNSRGVVEKVIAVAAGLTSLLSDVLASNGYPLNTRCGKRGSCHGCGVTIVGSAGTSEEIKSCQTNVQPGVDLVMRIPTHARLESEPQVGDSFVVNAPVTLDPMWPVRPGKCDTAFAVDVGTTTVAVAIVDLVDGAVSSRAGDFNAQIRFGDNVITRIVAAGAGGARTEMQNAVVQETIAPLLAKACREAGRELTRLAGGIIAGNTTMLHLLAGEDPAGLGVVPFTPKFLQERTVTAKEIGLRIEGQGAVLGSDLPLKMLPGFSAYVGADLTAGVYATGMMCDSTPSLLVDIGTNGEIVLQANGKLSGCATAAGPAFEGSGLLAGTRAQTGAISHVDISLNDGVRADFETIGGGKPDNAPGLCGTAYVDFLAVARRSGLLLRSGRFDPTIWERVPEEKRSSSPGGKTLNLAGDLCINEADIAALLQAKAAIGAGIETLLRNAGLQAKDIGTLYLAGGFGLFINIDHAIAIGLLPGFRREQVKVVGNTSLGGAILAALDKRALPEMTTWQSSIEILELNQCADFEDCYLDHLALP